MVVLWLPVSVFYLVEWDWDSQGWAQIRKKHSLDDPLLLYAGHSFYPQGVPRKEVSEGHRTLGICLDPSISFKYETAYLKKVADNIARRLSHDSLKRLVSRIALCIYPKLGTVPALPACLSSNVNRWNKGQCRPF